MKISTLHNLFSRRFSVSSLEIANEALKKLSPAERVFVGLFSVILTIATIYSLYLISENFMVEIPSRGGTLSEGVIGLPRFINPLLAISDTDRDLTALVYSGLLKAAPDGKLIPDLAENYSISNSGLTYTFTLKPNLKFHDGAKVTADDVIFTIEKAQDPNLKSPRRPNWEDVKVTKLSDNQVELSLKQPYAPLLENATLGILPKHIWNGVDTEGFQFSQYNVSPIGSGPYKIKNLEKNSNGIPTSYKLETFENYSLGQPYIKNIVLKFFQNGKMLAEARDNGGIQNMSNVSPEQAVSLKNKGVRIEQSTLPRIFAVFFNQNYAPLFTNDEVRQALNLAVDKESIVREVLNGYGIAIDSPIPPGLLPDETKLNTSSTEPPSVALDDKIASAKKILEKAKWTWNVEKNFYEKKIKKETIPLSFSISTSNAPELKNTALMLQKMWQKIGAKVEVKFFDIGDLNQNVIRARKYDALLFGEIIGRDLDLFAFWDSSQRNDPGLNVALYTNSKTDKLLQEGRTISDENKRFEKYRQFEAEIAKDIPAIFIYSPNFLYTVPHNLKGFSLGKITTSSERFLSINNWYIQTEKVWKMFTKANNQ